MEKIRFFLTSYLKISLRIILFSIGIGILVWILESFAMMIIFHEGDLITQIFTPSPHVILRRLVSMVILLGLFIVVGLISNFPLFYGNKSTTRAVFHSITKRDIVGRKRVEEDIERHNKEMRVLNAISKTVSQTLDLDRILNDAIREVLNLDIMSDEAHCLVFLVDERTGLLSLAAHQGTPDDHLCLTQSLGVRECICGLVVDEGETIFVKDSSGDTRHTRKWDTMLDHKDLCLPLKARGTILGVINIRLPMTIEIAERDIDFLATVVDQISVAIENARLFEEVTRQHDRLRHLGTRLAKAEEAERKRLAKELHDQVGQNLTALGVNINIINSQLSGEKNQKVSACLDESQRLVDETTERIRGVMADLRPPILDDYGIVAALHWYCDQFSQRIGIPVKIRGNKTEPKFEPNIEIALFRIAQEALTNITKHAEAKSVEVHLTWDEEMVRLEISDDGKGLGLEESPSSGIGWGLLIMGERAEAIGGQFKIQSNSSGKGTQIIVEMPL